MTDKEMYDLLDRLEDVLPSEMEIQDLCSIIVNLVLSYEQHMQWPIIGEQCTKALEKVIQNRFSNETKEKWRVLEKSAKADADNFLESIVANKTWQKK